VAAPQLAVDRRRPSLSAAAKSLRRADPEARSGSTASGGTSPVNAITSIPAVIYEETDTPPTPPQILATDCD